MAEIELRHQISDHSFAVLEGFPVFTDPAGQDYFLLPLTCSADRARHAALMTYVLNVGTSYGRRGRADFPAAFYCADEVDRIIARQCRNRWSYDGDLAFIHRNGARVVTAPTGMLMGVGGNRIQRIFSQQAGTAWGDIFMVNIGCTDPASLLAQITESGHAWFADGRGQPRESGLDLDRVLHHEERHARQWAERGYLGMLIGYGAALMAERVFGRPNRFEVDAGLSDGGYC